MTTTWDYAAVAADFDAAPDWALVPLLCAAFRPVVRYVYHGTRELYARTRAHWQTYINPRTGQQGWKSANGRVVYDNPTLHPEEEGGGQAKAAKPEQPAPPRGEAAREEKLRRHVGVERGKTGGLEQTRTSLGQMMDDPQKVTPNAVQALIQSLMGHTAAELNQLRREIGAGGRGRKHEMTAAIGERLGRELPAETPPKPAEVAAPTEAIKPPATAPSSPAGVMPDQLARDALATAQAKRPPAAVPMPAAAQVTKPPRGPAADPFAAFDTMVAEMEAKKGRGQTAPAPTAPPPAPAAAAPFDINEFVARTLPGAKVADVTTPEALAAERAEREERRAAAAQAAKTGTVAGAAQDVSPLAVQERYVATLRANLEHFRRIHRPEEGEAQIAIQQDEQRLATEERKLAAMKGASNVQGQVPAQGVQGHAGVPQGNAPQRVEARPESHEPQAGAGHRHERGPQGGAEEVAALADRFETGKKAVLEMMRPAGTRTSPAVRQAAAELIADYVKRSPGGPEPAIRSALNHLADKGRPGNEGAEQFAAIAEALADKRGEIERAFRSRPAEQQTTATPAAEPPVPSKSDTWTGDPLQVRTLHASGYQPNRFVGIDANGRVVRAGQGFVRKVGGRWVVYNPAEAWAEHRKRARGERENFARAGDREAVESPPAA